MWHAAECRPARSKCLPALAAVLLLLVACSAVVTPTPIQNAAELRIGIADSVRVLAEAVLPIYGDQNPALNLETRTASAAVVLEDLRRGEVDVVLVPGEPPAGEDWWASVVAVDALALVVNLDNPVTGLTLTQVQSIFQGKAWSWEMVGGPAASIEVVIREDGSGTGELFRAMVMQDEQVTPTALVLSDTAAVLEYVAARPWAIGYAPAAAISQQVKIVALDGLYPTLESVQGKSYPLVFPIYLLARQEPAGELRRFPVWLLSRDGQAVIGRKYGKVR